MKKIFFAFVLFSGVLLLQNCKKNNDTPAPASKGTLSGTVTTSASQPVNGAQIIVFNANTNTPVITVNSASNGSYTLQLDTGSYFIKVYFQGYQSIPLPGLSAVPFTITANNTQTNNYQMTAIAQNNIGLISGKITSAGNPLAGVLVVAHSGANGYSSISDNLGNYTIYNVPAGNNYSVKGYISNYNSDSISVNVTNQVNTTGSNIALTYGVSGAVTGAVTFLSTANKEVDVSLINPYTKETIPGLSTMTSGGTYTISKVPDGNYIARASFANDSIVMDPDWLLKNGQPYVSVSGYPTGQLHPFKIDK